MTFLRFFNVQGIAGIAVSAVLAMLFAIQKVETSHWRKQSDQFEQLYRDGQAALSATVSNYRTAAAAARAADRAAAQRAAVEQRALNERTEHDFEARLADARTRAERLRVSDAPGSDRRSGGTASLSSLSSAAQGADGAASEDRLSRSDALTATEQAIQLDELIGWVKAQAALDPDAQKEP
jgi:hypothetical protein